jgi:hypothetical protein
MHVSADADTSSSRLNESFRVQKDSVVLQADTERWL